MTTQLFILGFLRGFGGAEVFLIVILALAVALIPKIFYLLTLQNTMKAVSVQNQKMPPGQVWLELIPVFNLVWQFFNVINVSDSIRNECLARGISMDEDRPAYSIGMAHCILACCSVVPFLGSLAAIASLICWIVFWVKIANYKTKLLSQPTNFDNKIPNFS